MNKWSKQYFIDLSERVASSALGGVLAMITADASGAISGNAQQWWLIVGVPAATSLVKGLLANISSSNLSGSASAASVSSSRS